MRNELVAADSMLPLYEFAREYMNDQVTIPLVDTSSTAAISNLAAGVVRWEEFEIRRLFADAGGGLVASTNRLDEASLVRFCRLVRDHIPTLSTARFYFLFDDAGEPNIPSDAQQVLNDLVTSSNAVYCVKLSAERFSYRLRDSTDRTLEETHDITSFDMARTYATGLESLRMRRKTILKRSSGVDSVIGITRQVILRSTSDSSKRKTDVSYRSRN